MYENIHKGIYIRDNKFVHLYVFYMKSSFFRGNFNILILFFTVILITFFKLDNLIAEEFNEVKSDNGSNRDYKEDQRVKEEEKSHSEENPYYVSYTSDLLMQKGINWPCISKSEDPNSPLCNVEVLRKWLRDVRDKSWCPDAVKKSSCVYSIWRYYSIEERLNHVLALSIYYSWYKRQKNEESMDPFLLTSLFGKETAGTFNPLATPPQFCHYSKYKRSTAIGFPQMTRTTFGFLFKKEDGYVFSTDIFDYIKAGVDDSLKYDVVDYMLDLFDNGSLSSLNYYGRVINSSFYFLANNPLYQIDIANFYLTHLSEDAELTIKNLTDRDLKQLLKSYNNDNTVVRIRNKKFKIKDLFAINILKSTNCLREHVNYEIIYDEVEVPGLYDYIPTHTIKKIRRINISSTRHPLTCLHPVVGLGRDDKQKLNPLWDNGSWSEYVLGLSESLNNQIERNCSLKVSIPL